MDYTTYPVRTVEDIVRLRRRIDQSGIPSKLTDRNLIVGTWNVRGFGDLFASWEENDDSPKRNLRGLACIAEIVSRFDVIAIQEVKRGTAAIRTLLRDFLGPDWDLVMSDVTAGDKGNSERLAFIYDRRRVQPSGLAGEIVLPPTPQGDPAEQFDRTPYIVGFRSAGETFALLTAHIRYGEQPADRIGELKSLAAHIAKEIRDRASATGEANNLIVLGDFNIDERGDDPLFEAFVSTGLFVPEKLLNLRTTYNSKPKFYDQIAWFMDRLEMLTNNEAGVIDFAGAVFPELTPLQMTYRVSDHFPLWVEFVIDRSSHQMAATLGVDPSAPDPFAGVPG
jgi:endonuclease/exonuclease/phosphatase family metal-dependent hydrolase